MALSLNMVPVVLKYFLWKIWAKYHQLAVGPGISMLRACARSGSLRCCFVTNEGNSKPCVSQKPLSYSAVLHTGPEMAEYFLYWPGTSCALKDEMFTFAGSLELPTVQLAGFACSR